MDPRPRWSQRAAGHYAQHGAAVAKVGLISVIGIVSTFGFQILTARALGPADYGVLSSFFAIVSMAAIGSSSLQNAVAVQTARALASPKAPSDGRRLNGFTLEALVLGCGGAAIVLIGSPLIVESLNTEFFVPVLAALSILLSFVFARAVGSIQGRGDSSGAVWWTSISLVLRVALVAIALALGLGLPGSLASVLVASAVAMVGALAYSARARVAVAHRPFPLDGVVVILMTIAFAWLTNIDVILVRSQVDEHLSGVYAASATLVKAGFLIPATLSLYLLPRFVRQEGNKAMTRLGVRVTLLITFVGGLAMVAVLLVAGSWITGVVFGSAYRVENGFLVALALAYLPWIMAQGLLIRMNAMSSRIALSGLGAAIVAQFACGLLLLPDVGLFVFTIGCIGTGILVVFLVVDRLNTNRVGR